MSDRKGIHKLVDAELKDISDRCLQLMGTNNPEALGDLAEHLAKTATLLDDLGNLMGTMRYEDRDLYTEQVT